MSELWIQFWGVLMSNKSGPTVLVLHDSHSFCSLLVSMLRSLGVERAVSFDDGEAARHYMHANKVDVALIDGDLPNLLAAKFVRALRMDNEVFKRTVSMVLLSNDGGSQVIQKAFEAGFDAVLPKPIRTPDLKAELARLIDKPRVYIHCRTGYCGPDRRRKVKDGFEGDDRRGGGTFQVFTKEGAVSLAELEKLQSAGTGEADIEILLLRGLKILSGYRMNAHDATVARRDAAPAAALSA